MVESGDADDDGNYGNFDGYNDVDNKFDDGESKVKVMVVLICNGSNDIDDDDGSGGGGPGVR